MPRSEVTERVEITMSDVQRRLEQAESRAATARSEIQRLRLANDEQALNHALESFRSALAELESAKVAAGYSPTMDGFEPDPNVLFVRWLVQEGHLSEWN